MRMMWPQHLNIYLSTEAGEEKKKKNTTDPCSTVSYLKQQQEKHAVQNGVLRSLDQNHLCLSDEVKMKQLCLSQSKGLIYEA